MLLLLLRPLDGAKHPYLKASQHCRVRVCKRTSISFMAFEADGFVLQHSENVQKGPPTIHGMHCFVGSKNKLGDTMGQVFGCMQFKPKVLV